MIHKIEHKLMSFHNITARKIKESARNSMSNSGSRIISVRARQVFTARPLLGLEAIVQTQDGSIGRAVCNSGISIGSHEVAFQYDEGMRWGGKGVEKAAHAVNTCIHSLLRGMDATNQRAIDQAMLEANGKAQWGGNAVAAVSAAVLKAGAASQGIPLYRYIGGEDAVTLPVPGVPAANGDDRWGGGIASTGNKPTVSFMCYDFPSFSEASHAGWELFLKWKAILKKKGIYEGLGMMFRIPAGVFQESDDELFDLMANTICAAGYSGKIGIQMDCAADTYYDRSSQTYVGLFSRKRRSRDELLQYYKHIVDKFPIVSIEDPFHEDDYESHALLTKEVDIQIVGDDLFTTMKDRLKAGAKIHAANAMLVKVNQVGTITEAFDTVRYAKEVGYGVMPCDSRGEGAAIADYCVGLNVECVREKAIDPLAGNRFLEIEEELGARARFWGKRGLKGRRFA